MQSNKHKRIPPTQRFVECIFCSKLFTTQDKLRTHLLRVHRCTIRNGMTFPAASTTVTSCSQAANLEERMFRSSHNGERNPNLHNIYLSPNPFYPGPAREIRAPPVTVMMIPTNIGKREDTRTENASKKRKADHQNNSPSLSPYGMNSQMQTCICPCCGIPYPNFQTFMRHMESHIAPTNSSTISVNCPTCGESSADFESFTNHVFGHCIVYGLGVCCNQCKIQFAKAEDFQKHYHEVHVVPALRCTLCDETFENRTAIQIHMSAAHNEECNHAKCTFCPDLIFHDRISAEMHVSTNHFNQYFQGSNPPDQYAPSTSRRDNEEKYPECAFIFPCTFCPMRFSDSISQLAHIAEHQEEAKKETNSNMGRPQPSMTPSSSAEADSTAQKKQQKQKAKTNSFQCSYCNEICRSKNELDNHLKAHQGNPGKEKQNKKCNICDAIFVSTSTLAEHKLTHCKIVECSTCVQCRAPLTDEQCFYNHQILHSTSPGKSSEQIALPANCVICCQTLQNTTELSLHAKFHLKHLSKKFRCSSCNRAFRILNNPNVEEEHKVFDDSRGMCLKCVKENEQVLMFYQKTEPTEAVMIKVEPKRVENGFILQAEKKNEDKLDCKICKQKLSSMSELQSHLIEHSYYGINQFTCYLCSISFTGAEGLRKHMLRHGLDCRPYDCPSCDLKFFFRTELDNHMVIHEDLEKKPLPSEVKLEDVFRYETCGYCHNIYTKQSFAAHLENCSIKAELKMFQTNFDNNIKTERVDSTND
ncbi:hypothetical protein HHI36_023399 [Cryptolaemus montrouzieri]|uniref:C2H2-type domain-containing protein n=1 Tax=Cryptolaemus montrouzieri TaxID=559131 RepID=A0ABD2PGV0_9CUCU